MRMRLAISTATAACVLPAAIPVSAPAATSPCAGPPSVATASYRMGLGVGTQEEMYTAAEVKARHLTDGEIMLGGEMSMVDMAPAGSKVFHVEVHICAASGAVVRKANPTLTVNGKPLPAAIMVGIGEPMTDYHYGNDIALKPGAKLTVVVTVKGERAVLRSTVPR